MISLEKIERLLLQISLFLIPTNLAYHWYLEDSYINGRLVDYLLPKLYLSDIPIIFLIFIGIYRHFKNKNTSHLLSFPLIVLLLYLFINCLISGSTPGSLWFWAKVTECVLFGRYILNFYTRKSFLHLARAPLIMAIIFQSLLGLYQYINGNSLFGYIFLGEPNLQSTGIAHSAITGTLEVSPYGTTPHPNVLSGFLLIGSIIVALSIHLSPNLKHKKTLLITLIGLSTTVIVISESIIALSGAIIITVLYYLRKFISARIFRLIVLMCIYGSLLFSLLLTAHIYHSKKYSDNPSITNRYELNQVAFNVVSSYILAGVGVNNFTLHVPSHTFGGQRSLFIQPVHHIGLLALSETGFVGVILILWALKQFSLKKLYQVGVSPYSYSYMLPLIGIGILGSWDHYPLTLQTGQILTTLSLTIPLLRSEKRSPLL